MLITQVFTHTPSQFHEVVQLRLKRKNDGLRIHLTHGVQSTLGQTPAIQLNDATLHVHIHHVLHSIKIKMAAARLCRICNPFISTPAAVQSRTVQSAPRVGVKI